MGVSGKLKFHVAAAGGKKRRVGTMEKQYPERAIWRTGKSLHMVGVRKLSAAVVCLQTVRAAPDRRRCGDIRQARNDNRIRAAHNVGPGVLKH